MKKIVMVDSSVWISYYRPAGSADLKNKVANIIIEDLAATCGLIRAEVLQGTTDQKSFDIINQDFSAFQQIEITENTYGKAAKLAFDLRRKGITAPLIDIVISTLVRDCDLSLWHSDNHYEMIKKVAKIDTLYLLQK